MRSISLATAFLCCAGCAARMRFEDAIPPFRPGRTKRKCHVHSCDPQPQDEQLLSSGKCGRRGHLQPMGMQSDMAEVARVAPMSPGDFYEDHVARGEPVVLAGVASEAVGGQEWDDAFLEEMCTTERGEPWNAIIEVNKVIVTNTRWPLHTSWNFCDFIQNYTKPEHADSLYCVSALTDPHVRLGMHVALPSVLGCPEMVESVHNTRLWMSSGGTSSSLHFDTHENLMLQIDGEKKVYFWPPSESHLLYMDYNTRYGLSPVNPDRVDLDRFPLMGAVKGGMVAHLKKGDALFIPDGWWHQVRTLPGRNIAVTWEFEPYEGLDQLWPTDDERFTLQAFLREKRWSKQVRVKYRNKHLVTRKGGRIACNATVDERFKSAEKFRCGEDHTDADSCNFECLPKPCVWHHLAEKQNFQLGISR